MARLFDYIFSNLEERYLDIKQIHAYIRYLDKFILAGLSMEKELEYQAIKLKLLRRLHNLHLDQIQFYLSNQEGKNKNGTKADQ